MDKWAVSLPQAKPGLTGSRRPFSPLFERVLSVGVRARESGVHCAFEEFGSVGWVNWLWKLTSERPSIMHSKMRHLIGWENFWGGGEAVKVILSMVVGVKA